MKKEPEVVTHSQLLGRRVISVSYLRVEMKNNGICRTNDESLKFKRRYE